MRRIIKIELSFRNFQEIKVPADFQILKIGNQNNRPVIWLIGDITLINTTLKLCLYLTGEYVNGVDNGAKKHIETLEFHDLIYHFFQVLDVPEFPEDRIEYPSTF